MRDQHRALPLLPAVAGQAQLDAVVGHDSVNLGCGRPQLALLARRGVVVELALAPEDPTVDVEQRAREEPAELDDRLDPLPAVARVGRAHRRHLTQEVRRRDPQDALPQHRAVRVGPVVERHVERRRVRPHVEASVVADYLEALEPVGAAVLVGQPHAVAHVLRVRLVTIVHEQVERAVGDGQRRGRQRRRGHGPTHRRLVLGLRHEALDVRRVDREDERERLAGLLGGLRGRGVVVRDRGRDEPAHPLGELDPESRSGRLRRRPRGQPVIDRPAAILCDQRDAALGERGDRQQRVDAERARDDRSVGDVEPLVHIRPFGAGEDAALVVDGAAGRVGAHRAAAERVDRDQSLAERLGPDRVAHRGRLQRRAGRVEVAIDVLEDLLSADPGPHDAQVVVLELQRAGAPIVGHREEGLGVVDGAVARTEQQALRLAPLGRRPVPAPHIGRIALEVRRGGEQRRHEPADAARHRPLLDHHPLLELRPVAQVDDPGDAGADRLHPGRSAAAVADPVDLVLRVVGEREHVAVAAEATADAV